MLAIVNIHPRVNELIGNKASPIHFISRYIFIKFNFTYLKIICQNVYFYVTLIGFILIIIVVPTQAGRVFLTAFIQKIKRFTLYSYFCR